MVIMKLRSQSLIPQSLTLCAGILLFTAYVGQPAAAVEKQNSSSIRIAETKPFIRSLLPDNSLQAYCRDVRINTIVVPSVCTLIVEARRSYYSRDFQGAINLYSQVVSLNADYGQGYYNRGLAYLALGNSVAAKSDFRKAASLFQRQGDPVNQQKSLQMVNTTTMS
jgi:tetratricopeptide (TPR) repeat protein